MMGAVVGTLQGALTLAQSGVFGASSEHER
jgi:hypothetical protein